MKIQEIILQSQLFDLFYNNEYGLEKEGLRVLEDNDCVAMTDHPHGLGDRLFHPYIQTDYGESQPELITPPFSTLAQSLDFLKIATSVLYQSMNEDEYLWTFSVPPRLPADSDIRITESSSAEVKEYREYTGEKYGRSRQLMCGFHINCSLSADFIQVLYEEQETFDNLKSFQNYIYMKLARNFLRYQWILIYLFGATPLAEEDFIRQNKLIKDKDVHFPIRSIRNSSYGYFNGTDVKVRYDELENYIFDIEENILLERLKAEREYYGDVRLKGGYGKQLRELLQSGISYLEFRSMDLNPYSLVGLEREQIQFIHVFFMHLIWIEETDAVEVVDEGMKRTLLTAEEHPHVRSQFEEDGLAFIDGMIDMLEKIGRSDDLQALKNYRESFRDPHLTVAGRILDDIESQGSFIDLGHQWGQEYKKESFAKPLSLPSFQTFSKDEEETVFEMIREGAGWEELGPYFK